MVPKPSAERIPPGLKSAFRWLLLGCFLLLIVTQNVPNSRKRQLCWDLTWQPSQAGEHAPSADPSRSAQPEGTPIRVLQYNVQFLFSELALRLVSPGELGHWPSSAERAQAIGEAVGGECADIIALNESVNEDRLRDMVAAIELSNRTCGKGDERFYTVQGPELDGLYVFGIVDDLVEVLRRGEEARVDNAFVDGELVVISRFPIIETNSLIFSDSAGIDTALAKGALHARLWRGADFPAYDVIDVYATHLQAGEFPDIRRAQLTELAAFIHAVSPPSIPILIMGDFNIDGLQDAQSKHGAAYDELVSILSTYRPFEDVGKELRVGTNQAGTRRIDYILLFSDVLEVQDVQVEPFPCSGLNLSFCGQDYPTLSDHAAVSAGLLWRHLAPIENTDCGAE